MILLAASLGMSALIAAPLALGALVVQFARSLLQGRRLDRSGQAPATRRRGFVDLYDVDYGDDGNPDTAYEPADHTGGAR